MRQTHESMHALETWLDARGLRHVCVVSPHLDDAAFSLAHTLMHLPSRSVVTVFSAARADSPNDYSLATGFAGPLEEFEARRAEDVEAMAKMGVSSTWVDAHTDRFDHHAQARTTQAVVEHLKQQGVALQHALVLLPAGAGASVSGVARWWKRVKREPTGCMPHAEHEWVRDALASSLTSHGLTLGFYAEVPYVWAQSPSTTASMAARLARQQGADQRLRVWRVVVDAARKLDVVRSYASQLEPEFGRSRSYQLKTASAAETLYLPG